MAPIVTDSQRPRSRPATGVGSLPARLERWGAPVPATYAALLPRYLAARRDELVRLLQPIYLALLIFFVFFIITDVLLYARVLVPLLILRVALVSAYLLGWVGLRRMRGNRRVYIFLAITYLIAYLAISLMLVLIRNPTGFYAATMLCAIPLLAMLPMPRFWYLANSIGSATIYGAMMAAGGLLGQPNTIEMLVAMLGAIVIFGAIHAYVDHQRWAGFLSYTRSEELGARLQNELALARRIQHGLLQPSSPAWPGLDLVCWSDAAREVGGDFYAYLRSTEGRVGLAVGDVSGKGLPAALLMGTSLAYLRAAADDAASPGALLSHLDRALSDTTRATRQNCALCCVELSGPELRVANAGGVPPLLRRPDGTVAWVEAGGLPLGTGLASLSYPNALAAVGPGDLLVLVSDGVVEAMDEAGQLFGFERLEAAVAACDGSSAFVFVAELRDTLAAFMGLAEAHDDMTIVALRM